MLGLTALPVQPPSLRQISAWVEHFESWRDPRAAPRTDLAQG